MLTSLLPGLRELRAPLAAGYTWILSLWLAFHSFLPPSNRASGVYRDILDLANWAGKPATFAAVTLIAYVIGILSMAVTELADSISGQLAGFLRIARFSPASMHGEQTTELLAEAVRIKLSERFLADGQWRHEVVAHIESLKETAIRTGGKFVHQKTLESIDDLERTAVQDDYIRKLVLRVAFNENEKLTDIQDELPYIATRLLGTEEQIYGEYDRLRSESEFRLGMGGPILVLFVVVSMKVSYWWLFGVVVSAALLYLGSRAGAGAIQKIAAALAAGRVESRALERIMTDDLTFREFEDVRVSVVP